MAYSPVSAEFAEHPSHQKLTRKPDETVRWYHTCETHIVNAIPLQNFEAPKKTKNFYQLEMAGVFLVSDTFVEIVELKP